MNRLAACIGQFLRKRGRARSQHCIFCPVLAQQRVGTARRSKLVILESQRRTLTFLSSRELFSDSVSAKV